MKKRAFTVAIVVFFFLPQNDPFQKNCAIGWFDLDFNSFVNNIKVILSRSPVLLHILIPETENCPPLLESSDSRKRP